MSGPEGPLSAEAVLRALVEHGTAPDDTPVPRVTGAPLGAGQLADSFRLELTWPAGAAEDLPGCLVAKLPSADSAAAATAAGLGAYRRECEFYRTLAPGLRLRTPALYGLIEVDGEPQGMLLEDLSGSTRQLDQLGDGPIAAVEAARRQLVGLQSAHWDDDAVGRTPWLHRRLGVPIPAIAERYARSWATVRDDWSGSMEPREVAVVDAFGAACETWSTALTGPFTLVHHDFRFDNLLFSDRLDAWVLDWQTAGWGAPMFDVAYLLGTSLDPVTRAAHERGLVTRHAEELEAVGVRGFGATRAWDAYRVASFAVLLMLVPAAGSVRRTGRGDRMLRTLVRRGARQVLDLGGDELLDHGSRC